GDLEHRDPLPDREAIRAALLRHPDRDRFAAERAARSAALAVARAQRLPDLDLSAGMRRARTAPGEDDIAVVAGVSLPLPLWNRNADGVSAASLRATALERDAEAAHRERAAAARSLWTRLDVRAAEID